MLSALPLSSAYVHPRPAPQHIFLLLFSRFTTSASPSISSSLLYLLLHPSLLILSCLLYPSILCSRHLSFMKRREKDEDVRQSLLFSAFPREHRLHSSASSQLLSNVWPGTSLPSPGWKLGWFRPSRLELEPLETWTRFLRISMTLAAVDKLPFL